MKVNKIREISLNIEENILSASLSNPTELVLLTSSGSILRYNTDANTGKQLFSVISDMGYSDGGFDLAAQTSIYTMEEIVVVVNDYKRHGFVHFPGAYEALHLWREDYHADISKYPIALYKNIEGIPHLIYGEAWNHIQIMNLASLQILTASKSLIEENAEEWYVEYFKKNSDNTKFAWPKPYDYFFGELHISPNQKNVLSAGWDWGSFDSYRIFGLEKFIESHRISNLRIGAWEHENRATCWVDNNTVAVLYNPFSEGDENSTMDTALEIHLYKIALNKFEIEKKLQIESKHEINSKMYFDKKTNSFIIFSVTDGLTIISPEGETIFRDQNLILDNYYPNLELFLSINNKSISIYEIADY
jgi:hypothetical protein